MPALTRPADITNLANVSGEKVMTVEVLNSSSAGGTYTRTTAQGTKAGNLVFITGQVANKPGTRPADDLAAVGEMGAIEQQTIQVMENIKALLTAAGTSLDHVVKRNVYMTHASDFQPIYGVLERYFKAPVASTGVITGLIPTSARVEIDVIAVMPD
jgi:2-iminobutanoate/2-iminopropanoate deaminase